MSESKWKPGDVVRLKTGGWPMTVQRESGDVPRSFECVWFERHQLSSSALDSGAGATVVHWSGPNTETFHEDALEQSEPLK